MRSDNRRKGARSEPTVVLVKRYDTTRWLLERIDSLPKSQRFIFGQRMADHAIGVLELLVEAAYSSDKLELLARANRQIEVLRCRCDRVISAILDDEKPVGIQ